MISVILEHNNKKKYHKKAALGWRNLKKDFNRKMGKKSRGIKRTSEYFYVTLFP